mmetsp:Transcript_10975/g.46874  ORF Transcript_10975/g.46874 Transcript_10975/m.46874 type:complete len:328 (+) Transcript_10975:906-1889(+)
MRGPDHETARVRPGRPPQRAASAATPVLPRDSRGGEEAARAAAPEKRPRIRRLRGVQRGAGRRETRREGRPRGTREQRWKRDPNPARAGAVRRVHGDERVGREAPRRRARRIPARHNKRAVKRDVLQGSAIRGCGAGRAGRRARDARAAAFARGFGGFVARFIVAPSGRARARARVRARRVRGEQRFGRERSERGGHLARRVRAGRGRVQVQGRRARRRRRVPRGGHARRRGREALRRRRRRRRRRRSNAEAGKQERRKRREERRAFGGGRRARKRAERQAPRRRRAREVRVSVRAETVTFSASLSEKKRRGRRDFFFVVSAPPRLV